MRIILYLFLTLTSISAESIEQIIQLALANHPSLKSIQFRLSLIDEQHHIGQLSDDPYDAWINEESPKEEFDRKTLEPLQYQSLNLKQTLPWLGKQDLHKTYAYAQKTILFHSYNEAKIELSQTIRTTLYTFQEIYAKLQLVNHATRDLKQYSQHDPANRIIQQLDKKFSQKQAQMQKMLSLQEKRLNDLIQQKIYEIPKTSALIAPKPVWHYLENSDCSQYYQQLQTDHYAADLSHQMEEEKTIPDIYIKAGYFNQQAYTDFTSIPNITSITIGFSFPLYGKEKRKIEKTQKRRLQTASQLLTYHSSQQHTIKRLYHRAKEHYRLYHLLKEKTLPEVQSRYHSALSHDHPTSPNHIISLLEDQFAIELEMLTIKAEYLRMQALLNAQIGLF